MSECSSNSHQSLLSRKTREFRKQHRRKDLDELFSSTRKQMLRWQAEEAHRASPTLSQQFIDQLIDKLYPNSPEYGEAVSSLWTDCLRDEKMQLFSRKSIGRICIQVRRLKSQVLLVKEEGMKKNLDMLLWIVNNWTSQNNALPPEMAQLIPQLLDLLQADLHPRLNIIIIYIFTNCCRTESVRLALLKGSPIRLTTSCSLFENKQTDLSTFISTFLHNLPYEYPIADEEKNYAIEFVRKNGELCKVDKDLRVDCMLITSKLLIINEGAYHTEVIRRLSPNIKDFLLKLENILREEDTEDLLDLLFFTYKDPNPCLYPQSELFQEEMYSILWHAVSAELEKGSQEHGARLDAVRKALWEFLGEFCSIDSATTNGILDYFYTQCQRKLMEDQQNAAVKLLARHRKKFIREQCFTFWMEEFVELHADLDLCKDLLIIIRQCLDTVPNPCRLLQQQSSQPMMNILLRIKLEQDNQLKELASKVYFCDERGEMQDERQQNTSKKSFRTASQVFLTPLFIHSNPIVKPLTPTKHDHYK